MAIYLPASAEEQDLALDELTPREIVAELDKHVVGCGQIDSHTFSSSETTSFLVLQM